MSVSTRSTAPWRTSNTIPNASLVYQFGLEWGEVRSRSFRFVMIDEAFGRGSDESARFGLELFRRLNLQLLIVTPLQKIHIIEPYVSHVGLVYNPEGRESLLRNLTIEAYRQERAARESVQVESLTPLDPADGLRQAAGKTLAQWRPAKSLLSARHTLSPAPAA